MKKLIGIGILFTVILSLSSCTEQARTKSFGGSYTITLKPGQKLIEATWKGDDLWYLTREMRENETTETYSFQENSSFGVFEGTVKFKEVK